MSPPTLATERALLVRGEHPDPHRFLGRHGTRIRAWRPGASAVSALEGERRVALRQTDPAGVFEGRAPGEGRHLLEISYPDGNTFTIQDPYAFGPSIARCRSSSPSEGANE